LRDYLIEIKAKMQINNLWKIVLLRHKDVAIMDEVIKCGAMPPELRTFNNWRMFFQVNCLSEICNAEGTKIAQFYMTFPNENNINHKSKLQWPHQEKPSKKSFSTWTNVLRSTFDTNGINGLQAPLGPWITNDMTRHVEWAA
jgi:hypothetical protein